MTDTTTNNTNREPLTSIITDFVGFPEPQFLAEAVAMLYAGPDATWFGGIAPGFDLLLADQRRVKVKEAKLGQVRISRQRGADNALGAHVSRVADAGCDVLLFVCTPDVSLTGGTVVRVDDGRVVVGSRAEFALPRVFVADADQVREFVQPLARTGESPERLWAPVWALRELRPGDTL